MIEARERRRAYSLVRGAIQRGELVRPEECEQCGTAPGVALDGRSLIQAHHHAGYDQPLNVAWLCAPCHIRETPHPNPSGGISTGEANGFSKLTAEAVKDIRSLPLQPRRVLAERYGINRVYVSQVRRRKVWAHV